jgi:hypothetical protein
MKKAMCMIAIAAISFGTVYAAPYQQDTTKTKVKTKTSKSKTKTKGDSTKTKVKTKTPTPEFGVSTKTPPGIYRRRFCYSSILAPIAGI